MYALPSSSACEEPSDSTVEKPLRCQQNTYATSAELGRGRGRAKPRTSSEAPNASSVSTRSSARPLSESTQNSASTSLDMAELVDLAEELAAASIARASGKGGGSSSPPAV